jgi:hypothetical protein
MTLSYLTSSLSEEEYLDQRFKQAAGTGRVTRAAINNAKYFCEDQFNRELIIVMRDIRKEVIDTQNLDTALLFLQKLLTWSSEDHPYILTSPNACNKNGKPCYAKDAEVLKIYITQMRLYMKKVGGIPISAEDLKDYKLSYPPQQDKEEAEPLELREFKIICDNETDFRRRMMYRIMKDSEARIGAMVQLRKRHFNTEVRPIEVTFPKSIVKKSNGTSHTNTKYVIEEDTEDLLHLLSTISNDDSLVFGTNEIKEKAVQNEEGVWARKVQRLGFTDKYTHNGRLKKNLHSIKAMTFTAAAEAVDLAYAHAYGDHAMYTKTYLRWNYEMKIKKFRQLEKHISIYTKTIQVHDDTKLVEENIILKKTLENIVEDVKSQTRQIPSDELKKIMLQLLKENNIIQ